MLGTGSKPESNQFVLRLSFSTKTKKKSRRRKSMGPFRVRSSTPFTGGQCPTLPLASVGRPNPFPKVGIVFYNWSTIGYVLKILFQVVEFLSCLATAGRQSHSDFEAQYSSIPADRNHGFDPASEFVSKIGLFCRSLIPFHDKRDLFPT